MLHAIGVTLVRLTVTRRHLLEWETADSVARRERPSRELFLTHMAASPLVAAIILIAVLAMRPQARSSRCHSSSGGPRRRCWPSKLSRPIPLARVTLGSEDRQFLLDIARATWRYFDVFARTEDHGLPPDSVQFDAGHACGIAPRLPTLAWACWLILAAQDLGSSTRRRSSRASQRRLTTLERLERFNGHFLNWYDTRALTPLRSALCLDGRQRQPGRALVTIASGCDSRSRPAPGRRRMRRNSKTWPHGRHACSTTCISGFSL